MAGLLQSETGTPKGGAELTPQSIQAKMHLNPQQSEQLQRIVLAGKKVMYSQESEQMVMEQLQGSAPLPEKMGSAVAGLMGLLMSESKNSLPPNLIIPAGMVLVAEAADFLRKAGAKVSDQDIGSGIEIMTNTILKTMGLDPDKVAAHGAGQMTQGA